MKKILLLSTLAFLCLTQAFPQCITLQNPSFEFTGGVDNDSTPPPHWTGCLHGYEGTFPLPTVDTLSAYAGSTYAALYYTNNGGDTTNGAIWQRLNIPFVGGGTAYTMSVELSYQPSPNPTWADGAICQICGGYDSCAINEVLWTSSIIPIGLNNAPHWTRYSFTCHPNDADTFLIIRVTASVPSQQVGASFYIGVDSLNINCNTATAINELTPINFSLYPNPATNQVTVNTGHITPYILSLFDLTGREMLVKDMSGAGTLDVSRLAKGCYLAKVVQSDKSYCQKLIIQ